MAVIVVVWLYLRGEELSVKPWDKDLSALFRAYVLLPPLLTINMPWCEVKLSHFWSKKQNNLTWVRFFVVVELLARQTNTVFCGALLISESYLSAVRLFYRRDDGNDGLTHSCQCWGVSCLSSIFSAVDITGLYKVIMRAKRWIPPEMPQMPVCQAYVEGQRAL